MKKRAYKTDWDRIAAAKKETEAALIRRCAEGLISRMACARCETGTLVLRAGPSALTQVWSLRCDCGVSEAAGSSVQDLPRYLSDEKTEELS